MKDIKKSTKLEKERRIFTIQEWMISGIQDYLILKDIMETWGVGMRQAKNYLKDAYSIWQQSEQSTVEEKRALKIAELKQLIRSMKEEYKGTPKGITAINQVQKEINKLENLYPTRSLLIQGDSDRPLIITDPGERQKRINELMAKLKAK